VWLNQFATSKTCSMHVGVQDHLLSRNVIEWVRAFLKAEFNDVSDWYLQNVRSIAQLSLQLNISPQKSLQLSPQR